MKIQSTTHYHALNGINRGMQRLEHAAGTIASAGTTQEANVIDITEALIEARLARRDVSASAFAIKVEDEMVGSLLSIRV